MAGKGSSVVAAVCDGITLRYQVRRQFIDRPTWQVFYQNLLPGEVMLAVVACPQKHHDKDDDPAQNSQSDYSFHGASFLSQPWEKCFILFGRPDAGFLDMLTNKKLYALLRDVEDKRNRWKGHPGILSFRAIQEQVRLLEEYLSEIHQTISDWYDNALVISPGTLEFEAGIYRHQVKLIKGPTTPFMQETVDSSSPMDKRHLYMLHRNQYQPIELLPLFRLMESPRTQQNACYFYNRLDGEENVRWVSYHFENEAEISRPDEDLRSALTWLEPVGSEAS